MKTLEELISNLPESKTFHSQKFVSYAGSDISKAEYDKLKDNEKETCKFPCRYTENFSMAKGKNRFGKEIEVTKASDNATWYESNMVESLSIQSKPANAAEISLCETTKNEETVYSSRTLRWLKADLTDRQLSEIRTIRFKLSLTKELSFTIDALDRITKLKNNPNCKPVDTDLKQVIKNDVIRFTNKLADLQSEICNVLAGTEVKQEANIF